MVLRTRLVEEGLIKRLVASIKCRVCGWRYDAGDIDVIGHRDDLWFLRALCSICHTQCLVAAVIKGSKVPEVITDLSEAELDRFRGMGVLTADEVLDMHNFLEDFNGDFSRVFNLK